MLSYFNVTRFSYDIKNGKSLFWLPVKKRAGDGNRTHVSSLEGWCSTIELHPQMKCPVPESNQRHEDFQSSALPTELTGRLTRRYFTGK